MGGGVRLGRPAQGLGGGRGGPVYRGAGALRPSSQCVCAARVTGIRQATPRSRAAWLFGASASGQWQPPSCSPAPPSLGRPGVEGGHTGRARPPQDTTCLLFYELNKLCQLLFQITALLQTLEPQDSAQHKGRFALFNWLVLGHTKNTGVQWIYCNTFPAKPFYGSYRLDPVMIWPLGIDNGALVVSPETVCQWYAPGNGTRPIKAPVTRMPHFRILQSNRYHD